MRRARKGRRETQKENQGNQTTDEDTKLFPSGTVNIAFGEPQGWLSVSSMPFYWHGRARWTRTAQKSLAMGVWAFFLCNGHFVAFLAFWASWAFYFTFLLFPFRFAGSLVKSREREENKPQPHGASTCLLASTNSQRGQERMHTIHRCGGGASFWTTRHTVRLLFRLLSIDILSARRPVHPILG